MATVVDVAAYILRRCGTMTTMKLQKLAFYSQAESLTHRGIPLFDEDFQAWRGGPVCYDLYVQHRGKFLIRDGELPYPDDDTVLNEDERSIIDRVCDRLSSMSGNELSQRTHSERPWVEARGDVAPSAPCRNIISKTSMRDFYAANPVLGE